jgi:uncharacterized protein (DUF1697 family)
VTTHVAFLRAINVGGRGTLRMGELRGIFAQAGARNVRTVIQSGNVVFEAAARSAPSIVRDVRASLVQKGTSAPEIVTRDLDEIARLVASEPFGSLRPVGNLKLYVSFLARAPQLPPVLPLVSVKEALEVVKIAGRDAFVVSRPKRPRFFGFPNNFIEEQLGVPATTRNWSTVIAIARLAGSP